MNNTTLQLTIRGLDPETKDALVKRANQQGLSLNRYALKALQNNSGINDREKRYRTLKQFLSTHSMTKTDKKAFDEAIAWSDKVSIEKQSREEHEARI
ncbi:MAG TPA: hypothetical protein VMR95_01020 [Candidatus Binatia bacterium]|jgi:hypothetical protein|nr:hypothetical protein [Candidatus Binatia bacterium]